MQLQKVKLNNPFVAHTLNAQNTEPLNQRNYNLSAVTKKEKKTYVKWLRALTDNGKSWT